MAWDGLKRGTMRKVDEGRKTGAAGQKLSALDDMVLNIIGRDSVYLKGLEQPDDPPILSPESEDTHSATNFVFDGSGDDSMVGDAGNINLKNIFI
jgi:hypothetical protein